jgi:hypothetical protein
MGRQLPASVTNAIRAQLALIVVSGVATVLTVVQRDALVTAWAEASPNARRILEEGGLQALYDSAIQIPNFGPVAVVAFFTFALLALLLVVFFRDGHPSARLALTGLAAFFLLGTVVLYRQDPPVQFVVVAAVSAVLDVLVVYFLWHRDTTQFLRGADLAERRED